VGSNYGWSLVQCNVRSWELLLVRVGGEARYLPDQGSETDPELMSSAHPRAASRAADAGSRVGRGVPARRQDQAWR
jgi:hypothetical protein